jgi:hypothetical protein
MVYVDSFVAFNRDVASIVSLHDGAPANQHARGRDLLYAGRERAWHRFSGVCRDSSMAAHSYPQGQGRQGWIDRQRGGCGTFLISANPTGGDGTTAGLLIGVAGQRAPEVSGFHFQLSGQPGQQYVVETSNNLTDWTLIQTVVLTGSEMEVSDGTNQGLGQRFYRARLAPAGQTPLNKLRALRIKASVKAGRLPAAP